MAEMKPGDVRVFKGGTALVVGVALYLNLKISEMALVYCT
jgi:hypothetical protein